MKQSIGHIALLVQDYDKAIDFYVGGNQTGGRVFLFLHTDDFWRDYKAYGEKGVIFSTRSRNSWRTITPSETIRASKTDSCGLPLSSRHLSLCASDSASVEC